MLYFRMKLFYGSKTLLTRPTFGEGKPSNDYGLGFYLTPERAGGPMRGIASRDAYLVRKIIKHGPERHIIEPNNFKKYQNSTIKG